MRHCRDREMLGNGLDQGLWVGLRCWRREKGLNTEYLFIRTRVGRAAAAPNFLSMLG